jgi:chaperonin cofactor prefoldin
MISDAETAAKSYADGLAGNYDAKGSAAKALTDAKDYTDKEVEEVSATVSGIDERLDTVESKLANVTNVMDFRGAVDAIPTDVSEYQSGDVIVVTDGDDKGKEFVFDDGKFIEFGNVDAQQTAIVELQGRIKTVEDDLNTATTGLKAKVNTNTSAISALDTRVGELEKIDHEHANKKELDLIKTGDVAK